MFSKWRLARCWHRRGFYSGELTLFAPLEREPGFRLPRRPGVNTLALYPMLKPPGDYWTLRRFFVPVVDSVRLSRLFSRKIDREGVNKSGRSRPLCARYQHMVRRQLRMHAREVTNLRKALQSNLSRVIGRSRTRFPVAWKTAFAIAAATPVMPISPIPRAPKGACSSGMPV